MERTGKSVIPRIFATFAYFKSFLCKFYLVMVQNLFRNRLVFCPQARPVGFIQINRIAFNSGGGQHVINIPGWPDMGFHFDLLFCQFNHGAGLHISFALIAQASRTIAG